MESNHHLKLMRLLNYRYSNPLHIGLGGGNRTPATWPQTTNDTISPHRENIGAPGWNRTTAPALQVRTSTTKDTRANNFCLQNNELALSGDRYLYFYSYMYLSVNDNSDTKSTDYLTHCFQNFHQHVLVRILLIFRSIQ